MNACDYCGEDMGTRKEEARFCCDRHRAAWSREHDPQGVVRSVRRLRSGRVGVVLHFTDQAAIRFRIGEQIVLGAVAPAAGAPNEVVG